MYLDQPLYQRQTYSPAAIIGIVATLGLVVTVKDVAQFLFHDAYARIGHLNLQVVVGRAIATNDAGTQGNAAFSRRELEGVREQVVDNALYVGGREPHLLAVVLAVNAEGYLLLGSHLGKGHKALLDKVERVALLDIEWEVIGLYLVKGDQLADELFHLAGVAQGHVKLAAYPRIQFLFLHAAQRGHDERQGGLELVAHYGEEVELDPVYLLEFLLFHPSHLYGIALVLAL